MMADGQLGGVEKEGWIRLGGLLHWKEVRIDGWILGFLVFDLTS